MSKKYPGKIFAIVADVTKEASVEQAVEKIIAESGAIHGMVCNAGRTKHKPALDFTTEEIEQLWNVNVSSNDFLGKNSHSNEELAVWFLLLRSSRCEGLHQVGHQRIHCFYSFNGIVSSQQGKLSALEHVRLNLLFDTLDCSVSSLWCI
jgi:NAD(P)-dependent dehydrogenase (short-subunit alcohol dehydrogenase family)